MKGPRFPSGWRAIHAVVGRIPRGRVATYGQVAAVAGRPRGARLVGHALGALHGTGASVPWQRVLGRRSPTHAAISIHDPMGAGVQRELLEREGVRFDARGRVDLARFGWRPRGLSPGLAPASPARSPRRTGGWSGRTRSGRSPPRS